jgi:hypothetical protein
MLKYMSVIVLSFMVTGCSVQVPVVSVNKVTGEKFVGTAISGPGTIEMVNHKGTRCTGTFNSQIVMTRESGFSRDGSVTCSDGRRGTFTVAGTASGGQGVGNLSGAQIDVYYGQFAVLQKL